MADDDDDICPLCCEELDISDKNFIPCKCGYRVCMWCWHHIKDNLNGLCPACRTPYTAVLTATTIAGGTRAAAPRV